MSPPAIPFLDLKAINLRHREAYLRALNRVLDSGRLVLGDETARFEAAFAASCGALHCIGVGNGLDALQLVLRAWGIGPGDEVVVPSHTFIATWLAVSQTGARPVPVEPAEGSFNIDPAQVEAAITPHTKAIVAVHLYGHPAEMTALREVADRHGLRLLEDAAQAHGARLAGRPCGSLGDAAAFSFYPGKNLGALGDGGAITTDDHALAERLRKLRNYGSEHKYRHEIVGQNSRLDELQSAFLAERLVWLDDDNRRRRDIAARYLLGLTGTAELTLPDAGSIHHAPVWHLFVVQHPRRDALARLLEAEGIGCLVHYPVAVHRQPAYADHAVALPPLPLAERLAAQVLSLPMDPTLSDANVDRVVAAVRRACGALGDRSTHFEPAGQAG